MLLVFVLIPVNIYAYSLQSDNVDNIYTSRSHSKMAKEDCRCVEKRQYGKSEKNCVGNCGNPAWNCPANNTNFSIPITDYSTQAKLTFEKQSSIKKIQLSIRVPFNISTIENRLIYSLKTNNLRHKQHSFAFKII